MITIREFILAPYEIDVESRNLTLVKVGKKDNGEPKRVVVGYYSTLRGCITTILKERVLARVAGMDELEGQIISLKEFIAAQEMQTKLMRKMFETFAPDVELGEVPTVTPTDILKKYDAVNADKT